MAFDPSPQHSHDAIAKTAILLVNLGTPEAPEAPALKRYLREFLWDPRVVEIPRPIWWLILNVFILNTRPKQSAEKYRAIWTKDGSPLAVHTAAQTKLVRGYLGSVVKSPLIVDYAMRYGEPSVHSVMTRLRAQGAGRILVLPMYPQSAASSTGSAFDAVFAAARRMRDVPALRFVKHFHDHPRYIAALAQSVKDHWMTNGRGERLVMSFHGVPHFHLEQGDPYHCECHKTGRLVAETLGLKRQQWLVTFQSRFGRAEWLKPYTQQTLETLGQDGVKRVDVMCPGFVADCLETLEEIAIENKAAFLGAGGKEFSYIPCLNERDDWIKALCHIVAENLHGWAANDWDAAAAAAAAEATRLRAAALGAKD
ncbi:MAG: ferrochelatase [Betaproteobacteria bacterium]